MTDQESFQSELANEIRDMRKRLKGIAEITSHYTDGDTASIEGCRVISVTVAHVDEIYRLAKGEQ